MNSDLAMLEPMFGWVPPWVIGLLLVSAAVVVALSVHRAGLALATRIVGTRFPFAILILQRTTGPVRMAACMASTALVLPLIPFDDALRRQLINCFIVAGIALTGWISIRAVDMAAARYAQQFRLDVDDNFSAKKHVTQVRVFKRVIDTLIVIVSISAALMTFELRTAIRRQPVRIGRRRGSRGRFGSPSTVEQSDCWRSDRDHPTDPHRGCRHHRERMGMGRGYRFNLCRYPPVGLAKNGRAVVLLYRAPIPELDTRCRVPDRISHAACRLQR